MTVERQAGYEYRGWKLGERVKWEKDGKEHTIIAFFEGGKHNECYYIAVDCADGYHDLSKCLSTTILAGASYSRYMWVKEKEIEKIESDVENAKNQQTKVLYGEDAAEYMKKNYHNIFWILKATNEEMIYSEDKTGVKCILDKDMDCQTRKEITEKVNNETLEKIKIYDYERDAEKKEQAKEFVVTEEMVKRMPERMRNEKPVFYKTDDEIKPSYYKINVAGNECEVKDVIKATVKDYDSVLVANIIKYIMRYRGKNGLEDLKKARTYLNELISEMEENKKEVK